MPSGIGSSETSPQQNGAITLQPKLFGWGNRATRNVSAMELEKRKEKEKKKGKKKNGKEGEEETN